MSLDVVWEEYEDYILCDVNESLADKVKQFTVKNYIEKNTICLMISYPKSENYADDHNLYLDHIFADQSCAVLLNKNTEEVAAVAIMKTMTREMRSWTAIRLISKNRKLNALLGITRQMLSECEAQLKYPTGSLHIFELCAEPNDLKIDSMDWMQIMFHGAYRIAQSMKMPIITYIGFSLDEQEAATKANFVEATRIFYPTYTEVDGTRPVPPSDVGKMYAIFYYTEVVPYVPHDKMP